MRGVFASLTGAASFVLCAQAWTVAQTRPPGFRSGVQMVEVDVRVFDRQGQFVTDLGRDDFDVLENGVPQKIQTFYLVAARGSLAKGTAAAGPSAAHTWIFVFDHRHLLPGEFKRAHTALRTFIAERLRPGDLVGIVDKDKMVGNQISSIREEMLQALKKVKVPGDQLNRDNDDRAADDMPVADEYDAQAAAMLRNMAADDKRRAASDALRTIEGLVSGLTQMHGPKTVVYFSRGFGGADLRELGGRLRILVRDAAAAGTRMYVIDARGLARTSVQSGNFQPSSSQDGGISDLLNSLSMDTGGLMIFNENNIGRALDVVAADTSVYYVLGYQPLNPKYDRKYRAIDVHVKRSDVRVRARKGYVAIDPKHVLVPQPVK